MQDIELFQEFVLNDFHISCEHLLVFIQDWNALTYVQNGLYQQEKSSRFENERQTGQCILQLHKIQVGETPLPKNVAICVSFHSRPNVFEVALNQLFGFVLWHMLSPSWDNILQVNAVEVFQEGHSVPADAAAADLQHFLTSKWGSEALLVVLLDEKIGDLYVLSADVFVVNHGFNAFRLRFPVDFLLLVVDLRLHIW